VPPSSPAIAADAAGDVAFGGHTVADTEPFDFAAAFDNLAAELVPGSQGDRDGVLCPVVPLENMNVSPTDRRLVDLDQNVVVADLGCLDILHPDATFGFSFYQCFH
jgi:hypothetical protein